MLSFAIEFLPAKQRGSAVPTFFDVLFPFLPLYFLSAAVLGLLLAYFRAQPILPTIALVVGLAVLLYTCVILFLLVPVLGTAAAIAALAVLALLWRRNFIPKDGPTLLVATLGMAAILLLFA